MQILVHSRAEIEKLTSIPTPAILISIHNPGQPPANIKPHPNLHEILTLAFDDTNPSARAGTPANAQPMTRAQALQIRNFLQKHPAIPTLLIHCNGGYNRSPAIAAAIAEHLGLLYKHYFKEYDPNRYVYDLLCEAFEGVS